MITLTLTQGIDSGYAWPITDADGQPADLTGWTAIAQVRERESPTSPLLHEFTAAVDVAASRVTVSWTAEESLAWTAWSVGFFDVVLVDPDGRPVQVLAQGDVKVDRVVSHG